MADKTFEQLKREAQVPEIVAERMAEESPLSPGEEANGRVPAETNGMAKRLG
jgi:hypothetical protein